MATTPQPQYAFRSLKSVGLVNANPTYTAIAEFPKPDGPVKAYRYSGDGRLFGTCTASGVTILDADNASLVTEIPIRGVVDIAFSPKGSQISTWERHVKPADGEPPHMNLKVWDVATAKEIASFSQKAMDGWALQYSEDESRAVRLVTNELHVFNTADFGAGIVDKIRIEGVTSCSLGPGKYPSVAFFVAEKKGAPASVKIHSLSALSSCSGSKTFYKADKIQMKWSKNGINLLFLTRTDVDKTGKSYYGESNLYLMAAAGNFDCRVTLDKEGGIHDFTWSPNDREFAVTYGYMPAKTVIFDQRVNVIHDFGTLPRNFVEYSPQGRLLCIAGFGNLAGQVDIWDRKTLKKVTTIDAPNTVHCEWSPDGRFLLCATLSPRLRVDNGIKVFHYTGGLMHLELMEELYQSSWRPSDASLYPFDGAHESPPTASISVASSATPKPAAAAGGAYRPPHARGTLTPTLYKREDEGGAAYANGSTSVYDKPANGGRTSPGFASRGRRTIPGAAPPVADDGTGQVKESRRSKKGKNAANVNGGSGTSTPSAGQAQASAAAARLEEEAAATAAAAAAAAALSPDDKKRRALMKKLTAIDQLKAKKAAGEKLELTQHKKLESEAEIRGELAALDLSK